MIDHGLTPPDDLKVVLRPVFSLKSNPRNARTHSRRQIQQIADSIAAFGFNNPILVDENLNVLAGHGRLEAAKLLGLTEVPTVCRSHMTEAEKRAYVIADNRLAEKAGWDDAILAIEFQTLFEIAPEFDLTIAGFEIAEIDAINQAHDNGPEPDALDDVPVPDAEAPVITRRGDLWRLDRHRVLCADATQPEAYARLLEGEQAQMAFTDPPYNVPIGGHVSGLGQVQHAEFQMASGDMSEDKFTAFLTTTLEHVRANSADGAIAYVFMDWRHIYYLLAAGRTAKLTLKNVCVWSKSNAGRAPSTARSTSSSPSSRPVPHINSFKLGQHGRYRTNVWNYPGVNSFGWGRDAALERHPTPKPVALIADAMRDCSKLNGLILDPFLGGGTTVIAAESTGRRAAGFELDPRYVDCVIRRWQQMTGKHAVLAATGESFETVADARAAEPEEAAHG